MGRSSGHICTQVSRALLAERLSGCGLTVQLRRGVVTLEDLLEVGVDGQTCEALGAGLRRAAAACEDAGQVKNPIKYCARKRMTKRDGVASPAEAQGATGLISL